MLVIKIIVIIMIILALLCCVASFLFFRIWLGRKKTTPDEVENFTQRKDCREKIISSRKWFREQNPTQIQIQSKDGLTLSGLYLPCEQPKRTILCVHGYGGSGIRDFSYISKFYHENHCNLLLIDQRAHGDSEGKFIDLGICARYDVLLWVQELNSRYGAELPVYLDGVSMGAATVLMASEFEFPSNLCGIIADCGYTSPWDIAAHVANDVMHIPCFPMLYLVDFWCGIFAGYHLKDASATEALKRTKLPVLFVHGAADNFVPTNMSRINYEACASSQKWIEIIPKAEHAMSYMVEEAHCQEKLLEFFHETVIK